MELPFKDIEEQCRAKRIYSSRGEVGRTYLVEGLVAALWPQKTNTRVFNEGTRPPPPRQPPRVPMAPPPRMTQYFQALQLSPSAGLEDVKKAFRRLALKYHPDKNLEHQDNAALEF